MDLRGAIAKGPRGSVLLMAALALLGYALVEGCPQKKFERYYKEKMKAAKRMESGMDVIREAHLALLGEIDTEHDPNRSGLIGTGPTPITSKPGVLESKQAAANPNMAAVMIHLFKRARLKKGDVVAMSFSGSFPSLNMAALIAAEVLRLEPVIISSAAASSWGANQPELTWLDMERLLLEKGVIRHRSVAATLGGEQDRGKGLSAEGIRLLKEAIRRNRIPFLDPSDLKASFDLRMKTYKEHSGDRPIACYVNIGGNAGSVGQEKVKKAFRPGRVVTRLPGSTKMPDSVMTRMSRKGVPVINMIYLPRITEHFGLPMPPDRPPRVGEGGVFATLGYNLTLTWIVLVGLVGVFVVIVRRRIRRSREGLSTIPGAGG